MCLFVLRHEPVVTIWHFITDFARCSAYSRSSISFYVPAPKMACGKLYASLKCSTIPEISTDGLISAQAGASCASGVPPHQAHGSHQRCCFGDNPPVAYWEGTGALGCCWCNPACFPWEQCLRAGMNECPE